MCIDRHTVWNNRCWRPGRVKGMRDEKLLKGYNVQGLGDGYTKSPDFITTQNIHVKTLCLYSLNLSVYIKVFS